MKKALSEFKSKLEPRFEIKFQALGPDGAGPLARLGCAPERFETPIVQEVRVLNRVVRWTQDGWEVEPDQRQVDILVQELALSSARPVCTPGENEDNIESDENDEPLNDAGAPRYKAMAARAN